MHEPRSPCQGRPCADPGCARESRDADRASLWRVTISGPRPHARRAAPGLHAGAKLPLLKAGRQYGPQGCKLIPCPRDRSHHRRLDPFRAPTLHRPVIWGAGGGEHLADAPPGRLRRSVIGGPEGAPERRQWGDRGVPAGAPPRHVPPKLDRQAGLRAPEARPTASRNKATKKW